MSDNELTFNPIPVYFLSEHGYAPTEAGIEACNDAADQSIPMERWIEMGYDGTVIHSGEDLLEPDHLMELLKSHPDAFLAVSRDGCMDFCAMGKENKELVYYWLEKAVKEKRTSWDVIAARLRKEEKMGIDVPALKDRKKES